MMNNRRQVNVALVLFCSALSQLLLGTSFGWTNCSDGSLCPSLNTCCPTINPGMSTCISGNDKSDLSGDCCTDDDIAPGLTGCGPGYKCARNNQTNLPFCELVTPVESEHPPSIPRYRLCSVPPTALTQVYGLPISPDASPLEPQIAYYSTMGAINANGQDDPQILTRHAHVETVVITVHGSSRNADDYLCCTHSALPKKDRNFDSKNNTTFSTVMVIAPWLRTPLDPPVQLVSGDGRRDGVPLEWAEDGPISHTWRYGADALNTVHTNFSAYAVMDRLLQQFNDDRVRFPRLRRIVVAGHSAGGQYTQRWILLSNSPVLDATTNSSDSRLRVRTVVANPRSFCFLDNRRFLYHGTFTVPSPMDLVRCPDYNEWEWGLSPISNSTRNPLLAPYKDQAIIEAGGIDAMLQRYTERDVVYLAGELDTEESGNCRANLQGLSRRERSENFMASLQVIFGSVGSGGGMSSHQRRQVHHRLVVHGVHHNHCLMFQSPEGRQAFFGLHSSFSSSGFHKVTKAST